MFWFMAGDAWIERLSKLNSWVWPIAYVCLSAIEMVYPTGIYVYFRIPFTFIGIIAIWGLYDRIAGERFSLKEHSTLTIACSYTFFIYLFHEPTLNIVRKLLVLPLGHSSFGFAVNYLLSPWIFALIFIGIGYVFRRYLPKTYSLCTGGR